MPHEIYLPEAVSNYKEARKFLFESWLLVGLRNSTKKRLIKNESFLLHGGLAALSLPPVNDLTWQDELNRAHIFRILENDTLLKTILPYRVYDAFLAGKLESNISANAEEEAYINFELGSYLGLQESLGKGFSLEEMVSKFLRLPQGNKNYLLPEMIRYYKIPSSDALLPINNPMSAYSSFSLFQEIASAKKKALSLTPLELGQKSPNEVRAIEALKRLNLSDALSKANESLDLGISPVHFNNDYEDLQITTSGVDLKKMSPSQIRELADLAHSCSDSCQFYHGSVRKLKKIELIAPVNPELFGEALYQKWKKKGKERLKVLIPAQADEATIAGIMDHLLAKKDFQQENILKDFSWTLSDLCITPLLRVYAYLKERGILDSKIGDIKILSMNVFNWNSYGEKFDFIAADHFIELFANKPSLLESLIGNLAQNGQLILTTRCGLKNEELTEELLMENFYTMVDLTINQLLSETEELFQGDDLDGETWYIKYAEYAKKNKERVHQLISLLLYRKLREVIPFSSKGELNDLINPISKKYEVEDIGPGKVKIVVDN